MVDASYDHGVFADIIFVGGVVWTSTFINTLYVNDVVQHT